MDRAPGPTSAFVRGKSGYVPFRPGGLDEVLLSSAQTGISEDSAKGLRTIPPGFARGLRLAGDEPEDETLTALEESLPSAEGVSVPILMFSFYSVCLTIQTLRTGRATLQKNKSPKLSYVVAASLLRWMNSSQLP